MKKIKQINRHSKVIRATKIEYQKIVVKNKKLAEELYNLKEVKKGKVKEKEKYLKNKLCTNKNMVKSKDFKINRYKRRREGKKGKKKIRAEQQK